MKIYTASGWPFRKDVAEINKTLTGHGFNIVSTWIEKENGNSSPQALSDDAIRDTNEIESADVVLCLMMDDKYAYRGTNVEMGYGLALNKRIIIVCPGLGNEKCISEKNYEYPYNCMTNVFFWHPRIERVKTINEAVSLLKQ